TTETVMVEPSFLALTTTPSIKPSWAELTSPDSTVVLCARVGDAAHRPVAKSAKPVESMIVLTCMAILPGGRAEQGSTSGGAIAVAERRPRFRAAQEAWPGGHPRAAAFLALILRAYYLDASAAVAQLVEQRIRNFVSR